MANIERESFNSNPHISIPEGWKSFIDSDISLRQLPYEEIVELPTEKFFGELNKLVEEVVDSEDYRDSETGLISDWAWRRLVEGGVMSSVLLERDPERRQEEIMKTSRILSYHDLHLGLTYGIVAALGVTTLQRFSSNEGQLNEWLDVVRKGELIGLAITEWRKSGSAALEMDSNYEIVETDDGESFVNLDFSKHLQGLSGHGGLIVALLKKGAERKTVGLFFVPQELIETYQTEMAGLDGIRYGINLGKITLDTRRHLLAELPREKLDEFQDIFTKSRLLFISMTLGHLERMEFEANKYANERLIEGKPQIEIPAVRGILDRINAHKVITETIYNMVMNFKSLEGLSLLDGDTRAFTMEANIIKTLSTEYAADGAAWRAELMGGAAFYAGGALQDFIDIWPFQIFEGSRLFLNNQIARSFMAPTRIEGKMVMPGFSSTEHSNFLEYFFKAIEYREMFDGTRILSNLEEWTGLMLSNIRHINIDSKDKGVIGEIVARLFALGLLDRFDQVDAVATLNLEIAQLSQNFLYTKRGGV